MKYVIKIKYQYILMILSVVLVIIASEINFRSIGRKDMATKTTIIVLIAGFITTSLLPNIIAGSANFALHDYIIIYYIYIKVIDIALSYYIIQKQKKIFGY